MAEFQQIGALQRYSPGATEGSNEQSPPYQNPEWTAKANNLTNNPDLVSNINPPPIENPIGQHGLPVSDWGNPANNLTNNPNLVSDSAPVPNEFPSQVNEQGESGLTPDYSNEDSGTEPSTPTTQSSGGSKTAVNGGGYVGHPNELLQYPSYTYGLALHAMSAGDYIKTINSGKFQPESNVMIASAGRFTDGQRVEPFQGTDFYFSDFKMTTVIGAAAHTQQTNAIQLSFTIIEPNGITLMKRMVKTAIIKEPSGEVSYLELPYMIQIDFFGYDDNGVPLNGPIMQPKYIPVKLIAMKMRVSAKGAEYQFQAVPYNHAALTQTEVTVPVNCQVVGENIGNYLKAESTTDVTVLSSKMREDISKSQSDARTAGGGGGGKPAPPPNYETNSVTDAINAYYKAIQEIENLPAADEIAFKVHPDFIMSPVQIAELHDAKTSPSQKDKSSKDVAPDKPNKTGVKINAGDSIMSVIEKIMKSSDYIRNQVYDPNDPAEANRVASEAAQAVNPDSNTGKINWFKIIPQYEPTQYLTKQRRFAKKITYHIIPYEIYNNKLNTATRGIPTEVQKSYNFIYTGKNDDIIDFQIDFDALYYVAKTVFPGAASAGNTDKQKDNNQTTKEKSKEEIVASQGEESSAKAQKAPDKTKIVPQTNSKNPKNSNKDKKAVMVDDLHRSLMSSSRGDMINVKLKITGDPQFIKQDDFFYNPASSLYKGFTPNNSLATDYGELHAYVTFKAPSDFSEKTGLTVDDPYSDPYFDGIYRILMVESTMTNGKFEQTLDLIRIQDQDALLKKSGNDNRETGAAPNDIRQAMGDSVPPFAEDAPMQVPEKTGTDSLPIDNEFIDSGKKPQLSDEVYKAQQGGSFGSDSLPTSDFGNVERPRMGSGVLDAQLGAQNPALPTQPFDATLPRPKISSPFETQANTPTTTYNEDYGNNR